MKIALVQVASPPEESVERRRARVGRMVRDARGADLVVLPELWAPGSFVERDARGRLFNTALLVAPHGHVVHRYRKVHVFGYRSREPELLTPGEALDVVDTDFGPTTCYDLRFPELWRGLVDRGARTVVVPLIPGRADRGGPVDPAIVEKVRAEFPVLSDRRWCPAPSSPTTNSTATESAVTDAGAAGNEQ